MGATAISIFGGGNGTTIHKCIRILLYLTQFCIRRQVHYPSYGPWPHVPPHVLVVILWALLFCYASKQVARDLFEQVHAVRTQYPRSAHTVQLIGPGHPSPEIPHAPNGCVLCT